jgi:hypothetical protein
MKRMLFGGLAAVLLAAPALCAAQATAPPMSHQTLVFDVSSLNGLPLHGEARGAEGLDYTAAVNITVEDSHSILHRLFLDRRHHVYFGYNLIAYPQQDGQVHLHFAPLTRLTSFSGIDSADFTFRSLPLPPDQTVSINSPVEVPLEIDAAGGRILRDKLTFGPPANTP